MQNRRVISIYDLRDGGWLGDNSLTLATWTTYCFIEALPLGTVTISICSRVFEFKGCFELRSMIGEITVNARSRQHAIRYRVPVERGTKQRAIVDKKQD